MPVAESLNPQQILAAQNLALGHTQGVAAKEAGVTKITIVRWLRKPHFKEKVQGFKREIEQIEGESFKEAVKEVGETIRENVKRILTPDELKVLLSDMAQDLELSPMLRLKAASQLGKWIGLEAPKTATKEEGDGFPIPDVDESVDVSSLSDEELQELYLKTLAES